MYLCNRKESINNNNMKQILLFLMIALPSVARADDSGSCGNNLTFHYVESTKTLTISGEGTLYALGGQEGAGIGGNGDIVIENGTIIAYGGEYGAGIGSEMYSLCGNITIKVVIYYNLII